MYVTKSDEMIVFYRFLAFFSTLFVLISKKSLHFAYILHNRLLFSFSLFENDVMSLIILKL